MSNGLLNELINLKEERRVLRVECGGGMNENTFSKEEMEHIRKHRNDTESCIALSRVEGMIERDETILKTELRYR